MHYIAFRKIIDEKNKYFEILECNNGLLKETLNSIFEWISNIDKLILSYIKERDYQFYFYETNKIILMIEKMLNEKKITSLLLFFYGAIKISFIIFSTFDNKIENINKYPVFIIYIIRIGYMKLNIKFILILKMYLYILFKYRIFLN